MGYNFTQYVSPSCINYIQQRIFSNINRIITLKNRKHKIAFVNKHTGEK